MVRVLLAEDERPRCGTLEEEGFTVVLAVDRSPVHRSAEKPEGRPCLRAPRRPAVHGGRRWCATMAGCCCP